MSGTDTISSSHFSPELFHKDSFHAESCNSTLDISQDEVQSAGKKSECDFTLNERDHPSEPLLEDFLDDSEDASEKLMSVLSTLRTCPVGKDSFCPREWKDSKEESTFQEESPQQCIILNEPKESCGVGKHPAPKTAWEVVTEETLPAQDLVADTSAIPIQEVTLAIMGESLLDCIVKDSPSEVSRFFTHPTSSLLKANVCSADEDFLITSDGSNVSVKTSQNGNTTDTEQPTESADELRDTGLTISADTLDESQYHVCTLVPSNRHQKEFLKRNLAYCISQEVVSSPQRRGRAQTAGCTTSETDTEQPTESREEFKDTGLTISAETLDENLDYVCTLMQSNKHLKERIKRKLACCINQEVVNSPCSPEMVGTVSKRECKVEKKVVTLQAENSFAVEKDCTHGGMGDKSHSLSHITRSRCLNPYEASLTLCERNSSEFSSMQLLLQEGDEDFYKTIRGIGQDQQKQLTHVLDLQQHSVFLEKEIKEMEMLLLQEEDVDWGKAIQQLKQDQKKQQTQIMDLYYDAVSLGARIKELEVDVLKQQDFFDTINTLKRNVAYLTETKNKAFEEKDKAESCLKNTEEALTCTRGHLQDLEAERSTLMLQLKTFKANLNALQENHQEEVEQKSNYMSQCVELDSILRRKEQEIQALSEVNHKLEQDVSDAASALHKTKEEKHSLEKRAVSLKAALQRLKDERRAERKKQDGRYNTLVAQIKILQEQSENEQMEMEKMQQQIHTFIMENGELQQQVTKAKNENHFLQAESTRWKEQCDQIRESQTLKEKMQYQTIKLLRYKLRLQQEELKKKDAIIEWKMHILGRFHLDMKSVHCDLSTRSLHTEENDLNSPYIQKASHLLSKIRSLLALTEGLLTCQKHRESTAAIQELIINEKPSEGHSTEGAGAGQEESPHGSDLPDLLRTKRGNTTSKEMITVLC